MSGACRSGWESIGRALGGLDGRAFGRGRGHRGAPRVDPCVAGGRHGIRPGLARTQREPVNLPPVPREPFRRLRGGARGSGADAGPDRGDGVDRGTPDRGPRRQRRLVDVTDSDQDSRPRTAFHRAGNRDLGPPPRKVASVSRALVRARTSCRYPSGRLFRRERVVQPGQLDGSFASLREHQHPEGAAHPLGVDQLHRLQAPLDPFRVARGP